MRILLHLHSVTEAGCRFRNALDGGPSERFSNGFLAIRRSMSGINGGDVIGYLPLRPLTRLLGIGITAMAAILIATLLSGCEQGGRSGDGAGVTVLKVGHVLDAKHPVHKGMIRWSELLEERSDGQLQIKIYAGGQLGQEKELIEQLQGGTLDLAKVSSSVLESFVPEMKVFGVPYLFRDKQHKWESLQSPVGQEILDACESRNMVGIGYYAAGERSFYTVDRPIRTPADLKNLKIRVIKSPMAIELVKVLGASPTPISWGELYTALQQGLVDGAENNPPSVISANHYEICKYYSLDRHTSPMDVVVAGKRTWERLSAEDRQMLLETFEESVGYQRELWAREVADNFKMLKEAGVEIIEPDLALFRQAVQPMYQKYLKDRKLGSLIKDVQAAKPSSSGSD
ncbi:MAG: TRAP transporter substrate-binding protein [Planctomycetota bacterium]